VSEVVEGPEKPRTLEIDAGLVELRRTIEYGNILHILRTDGSHELAIRRDAPSPNENPWQQVSDTAKWEVAAILEWRGLVVVGLTEHYGEERVIIGRRAR